MGREGGWELVDGSLLMGRKGGWELFDGSLLMGREGGWELFDGSLLILRKGGWELFDFEEKGWELFDVEDRGCPVRRLEQVGAVRWGGKRPDIRVGSCFRRALSGHRRERVDTVRVGAATGPTFASALVVDGRYLCSCVRVRACESRVSTGWQVGSGVWT